jgi:NTE family protein
MNESNTKKVLTWLQSAVGRVREFAYADPPAQPQERQERPRIGVALGGGFARGIAHLGVLRVLEEENIPIDVVTGTSAGALVAISYASGHTIPEIERQAQATRFKDFGNWKLSWLGLATNQKLEHYPRKYLGVSTFDDLKIPLAVAATDLATGEAVYFSHGQLGPALRASCAYPGMFVPV